MNIKRILRILFRDKKPAAEVVCVSDCEIFSKAKEVLNSLIPGAKLPEGAMLETFFMTELRLVNSYKGHLPGVDGMHDKAIVLDKNLNDHELVCIINNDETRKVFLDAIDTILGTKRHYYDAYTNGYYWVK